MNIGNWPIVRPNHMGGITHAAGRGRFNLCSYRACPKKTLRQKPIALE